MKLSELAAKPKLMKLTLDDADTVKEYGEPLEFYTWDRQPIDMFLKLSSINDENQAAAITTVTDMILDDEGRQILRDGATLPVPVMMRVITKVVDTLGKL